METNMQDTDDNIAPDSDDFLEDASATTVVQNEEQPAEPSEVEKLLTQKQQLMDEANSCIQKLSAKNKFDRKDITRAFDKLQTAVNAIDSFTNLLIRDLQIVDGRFTTLEENLFRIGQQQSIFVTALKMKNAVTDEELLAAWNDKVKPELESKLSQFKKVETTAVVPEPDAPPIVA